MLYHVEIRTANGHGWLFWFAPDGGLEGAQRYVEYCRKYLADRGTTGVEYRIVKAA